LLIFFVSKGGNGLLHVKKNRATFDQACGDFSKSGGRLFAKKIKFFSTLAGTNNYLFF